jgi:hypothetical protein
MGEAKILGQGYDERTGRVWCTLWAISDFVDSYEEITNVLRIPQGNAYQTHYANVESANKRQGYEHSYGNRELFCKAWAQYEGIFAARAWIRATFYLDTREPPSEEESKEFFERIDPDRAKHVAELQAQDHAIVRQRASEAPDRGA